VISERNLPEKIRKSILTDKTKAKEIVHSLRELLLNVSKNRIPLLENTSRFFKKHRTQIFKFIDIKNRQSFATKLRFIKNSKLGKYFLLNILPSLLRQVSGGLGGGVEQSSSSDRQRSNKDSGDDELLLLSEDTLPDDGRSLLSATPSSNVDPNLN
jgi:hypothetical protein